MAHPALESVKLLANHGARVTYRSSRGPSSRFERPNGLLSVPEAAALLKTNRMRILRMASRGQLELRARGPRRVPLAACRRLLKLPPWWRFIRNAHKGAA